jgi:uncharacterized protein (UPF0332 family)
MQPNPTHNPEDLAHYRIDKAKNCLQGAESEMTLGLFENAANRSYYCIFNAMRAVLALDQFDSKKHSGVISAFNKDYIKTGIFPKEFSKIVKTAFIVRNESDYKDFYLISKADVAEQVENAKTFLEAVEKYVGERIQKT